MGCNIAVGATRAVTDKRIADKNKGNQDSLAPLLVRQYCVGKYRPAILPQHELVITDLLQ